MPKPTPEIKKRRVLEKKLYERQAEMCKVFANPLRLQILDLLSQREWPSSELQAELEISKTNLSQHVAVLKAAGVISLRREGQRVFCVLAIPEVEEACSTLRKVLRRQMEGDSQLLNQRI